MRGLRRSGSGALCGAVATVGTLTLVAAVHAQGTTAAAPGAEIPAAQARSTFPFRFAYITNQGSQTVSVVDLDTWAVIADIKVEGRPAGIAMSPDGKSAYVTAPEGRDVVVIDTRSRSVVRRLKAGDGPLGIATLPDGRLLVADWYATHVAIVDPATGTTVARLPSGTSPSGVAATRDGRTVVSADRDSNQVSISRFGGTDGSTVPITDVVPVGTRPFGVTVNADGSRAYTANVGSNDVTVVDLIHNKTLASIPVGRRPYAVALSDRHGFVTDQYGGTITVFDIATNAVTATVEACDHPEGIAHDAGRRIVYVACWGDNVLLRLSSETLKVIDTLPVGDGPRAFGDFLGR